VDFCFWFEDDDLVLFGLRLLDCNF
jgi:hypothetical protein